MNTTVAGPMIYLLALEPSGDVLGAKLMKALRQETEGAVRFAGVGGQAMRQQGISTLFDPSELAILGIFEVVPKARLVLRRVRQVLEDIERIQPDILITIDSWGFTGRVHKALSKRDSSIKRVRYVAPQVWAWRPGRAKQLAQWIDLLITLFPFEPPLFERHGLKSVWVGHPVVEDADLDVSGVRFRSKHGLSSKTPLLSVLPGSRDSEVRTLSPVFADTVHDLAQRFPEMQVVIPTVTGVETKIRAWAKTLPVPAHVLVDDTDRRDAVAASQAALAASGTITLELAMARVPHVIAYKVNSISAFVFRHIARTKHVNLINILLGQEVVPELLQQNCRADLLSSAIAGLMTNTSERHKQLDGFKSAMSQLRLSGKMPSHVAASAVLGVLNEC